LKKLQKKVYYKGKSIAGVIVMAGIKENHNNFRNRIILSIGKKQKIYFLTVLIQQESKKNLLSFF